MKGSVERGSHAVFSEHCSPGNVGLPDADDVALPGVVFQTESLASKQLWVLLLPVTLLSARDGTGGQGPHPSSWPLQTKLLALRDRC